MGREQLSHHVYDSRRGGLSKFLQAHSERRGGVTYYELNAAEGDPFRAVSESLRYFVGGDHIPFGNNYKMILRRRWVGIAAKKGYEAFIDFKEGRITQEQYEEQKAKTEHVVERNAEIRGLSKKIDLTSRRKGRTIHVRGDIHGGIDFTALLESLGASYRQPPPEPAAPTPSFGEETYSYVGRQSVSGRREDSDANILFDKYVAAAKAALITDTTDPELLHAKATLAAIHRLNNDLVHYKRTRRGMAVMEAIISAGEKKSK